METRRLGNEVEKLENLEKLLQCISAITIKEGNMVRVKLFANFREIAGKREIEVDAEYLKDLLEKLTAEYPEFEKLMGYAVIMVNGKIADRNENVRLREDDAVAIFPPVSGGVNAF